MSKLHHVGQVLAVSLWQLVWIMAACSLCVHVVRGVRGDPEVMEVPEDEDTDVRLLPVGDTQLFRERLVARLNDVRLSVELAEQQVQTLAVNVVGMDANGVTGGVGGEEGNAGVVGQRFPSMYHIVEQQTATGVVVAMIPLNGADIGLAVRASAVERREAMDAMERDGVQGTGGQEAPEESAGREGDAADGEVIPSEEVCAQVLSEDDTEGLEPGEWTVAGVLRALAARRSHLMKKQVCLRALEKRLFSQREQLASPCDCDLAQNSPSDSVGPFAGTAEEDVVNIVYAVDEECFAGLGASINAILRHLPEPKRRLIRFKILVAANERVLLRNWLFPHLDALYGVQGESEDGGNGPSRWPFEVEIREFTNTVLPNYFVRGPKAARLSKDIVFARLYAHEYFPEMERYIYVDADVIIRRDITDLWNAVWKNRVAQEDGPIIYAFRNCETGYHHYFDMKNKIVSGRFVPRRCTFEVGLYLVDARRWRDEHINDQFNEWVTINTKVPLFIGAVHAPLMALFYDRYGNIETIPKLNWTHVHGLGKTSAAATQVSPEVLPGASSIEWNGRLKPWHPNGRSLSRYWDPYALTDPSFAKYKWETEDAMQQNVLARNDEQAADLDDSDALVEILKQVSENMGVGRYMNEHDLQELRSLLHLDLGVHSHQSVSSSNKLLLLVFATVLLALFMCLHCGGGRQHKYEAMQIARIQHHMRKPRVLKEITLTTGEGGLA